MHDLLCLKLSTYLSDNHQVAKKTVKVGTKHRIFADFTFLARGTKIAKIGQSFG